MITAVFSVWSLSLSSLGELLDTSTAATFGLLQSGWFERWNQVAPETESVCLVSLLYDTPRSTRPTDHISANWPSPSDTDSGARHGELSLFVIFFYNSFHTLGQTHLHGHIHRAVMGDEREQTSELTTTSFLLSLPAPFITPLQSIHVLPASGVLVLFPALFRSTYPNIGQGRRRRVRLGMYIFGGYHNHGGFLVLFSLHS